MNRLLDTVYFGRMDRSQFFVVASSLCLGTAALVMWLIVNDPGADPQGVTSALGRNASLLDMPAILTAHGLSEGRAAGVMSLVGVFLTASAFVLAARARDMGLWGWPTSLASLATFVMVGQAQAWVASLSLLLAGFFLFWPSKDE